MKMDENGGCHSFSPISSFHDTSTSSGCHSLSFQCLDLGLVKSPKGERKTSKVSSSFWGWLPYELGMIRLPVVIGQKSQKRSCKRSPTRSYHSQDSEDETDASQSSKACHLNAVKQRLLFLAWSCLRMIYATRTQLVMSVGFGSMIPFMIHSCINRIFVKHIYIISSSPSINEHHVLSRFFCQRRWTRFTLRPKLVNLSSNMLSFETFSVVDRQEESPMTDASSSKTTDREENGRDTIRRIDSWEFLVWMDGQYVYVGVWSPWIYLNVCI